MLTPAAGRLPKTLCIVFTAVLAAACGDIKDSGGNGNGPDAGGGADGHAVGDAPDTMLTVTPAALSNDNPARFEFSSDVSGVTFECSVDGATPSPCTSPLDVDVTEGDHSIEVTAIDGDNQRDASPASFAWTVDLTPPDVTIIAAPPALDNSVNVTFAFSASEEATYTCALDGSAAAPCTSPFDVNGLSDGAHQLVVTATDLAGNDDPTPATHDWTVDSSTPDTQIDTGPSGDVSDTAAQFTFSSADAGAGAVFECALDGGAFATCTSPHDLSGLGEGEHTFEVRVRDATNNVDPTPATRTWTVDTVAPTATITGGPNGPTTLTQPAFTFETDGDPTVVECRFDSDSFAVCSSPIAPTSALADGNHRFEVRVGDAAGNTSTASRDFSVDTMGPTVTITGGPSGATNDDTPTFTFTTAGAPTSVQCKVDNGTYADCSGSYTTTSLVEGAHTFYVRAADAGGNDTTESRGFTVDTTPPTLSIDTPATPTNDDTPSFSFTTGGSPDQVQCKIDSGTYTDCAGTYTPSPLADGPHTFSVRARDAAGNQVEDSVAVTVDTAPPTISITAPTTPTNDATPSFTFTTGGSPVTVECRIDSGTYAACSGSYTPSSLSDGSHTFTVRAIDEAGNTATDAVSVTVDTAAPTVSITTPTSPTNDATPTFTFTTGGSPSTVQCRIDTGSWTTCSGSYTASSLSDGTHTFYVRARDAATNETTRSVSVAIDTNAPTVSIANPTSPTNDRTPTFTFSTGGSPTSVQCRIDSGTYANCTGSYTPSALGDGTHTFYVRARDAATNETIRSVDVSIDTVGPTVNITGPGSPTNDATPTFNFSVSGASSVQCKLDGAAYANCSGSYTASAQQDGTHRFYVQATDAAGNVTTEAYDVVIDTVAPTVSFGNAKTATNDSTPTFSFTTGGSPVSTVCWYDNLSNQDCSGSYTAPSTLADGTHALYVQVKDAAGNVKTYKHVFTVDTKPPSILDHNLPQDGSTYTKSKITFQWITSGADGSRCRFYKSTDIPPKYTSCTSPLTISNMQHGVKYYISVQAYDAAGNTATITRLFKVVLLQ